MQEQGAQNIGAVVYKYTRPGFIEHMLGRGTWAFPLLRDLNDPFESRVRLQDPPRPLQFRTDVPIRMADASDISGKGAEAGPLRIADLEPSQSWSLQGVASFTVQFKVGFVDMRFPVSASHTVCHDSANDRRLRELVNAGRRLLPWFAEHVGVFSASACPDDATMWAHYADSGRGVCFAIDTDAPFGPPIVSVDSQGDISSIFTFRPVRYASARPEFADSLLNGLDNAFFTKHTDWQTEREIRLLRPIDTFERSENGIPITTIRPGAIRSVIIGYAASQETISLVKRLRENWPGMKTRYARIPPDGYKVEIALNRSGRKK
jgi:hypothetical protein